MSGDLILGRTIGDVEIDARLGAGGMASVYAGRDLLRGGARVAVKLLSIASHDSYHARFVREARIGAAVANPLCVGVVRDGVSGDFRYMVMELVEGEDLSRVLRREGPLHWTAATLLGRDLALALAAVHERGVVHRDLKPQNVLVDLEGHVKLADFGLAHWRDGPPDLADGISLTATGDAFGTPAYMAPEQFSDAKSAGAPADLYALGVLLFEALCGRPPFAASSPVDLARLHREVAPPSLAALAGETPERLRALVEALLAKDPGDRPGPARAVAAQLEAVAARGPTSKVLRARPREGSGGAGPGGDPTGAGGAAAGRPSADAPAGDAPGRRRADPWASTEPPAAPSGGSGDVQAQPRTEPPPRARGRRVVLCAGALVLLAAGLAWAGERGLLALLFASPEERARLAAVGEARRGVAEDARPLVDAVEDYLRDFGETGWLRAEVLALRDAPVPLGGGRFLVVRDRAELVHVPAGRYAIGVPDGDDRQATRAREVRLGGFLIDREEVSNERYERFLAKWQADGGRHLCGREDADHLAALARSLDGLSPLLDGPVVAVTPWDALEYARFYGRRLPSEAEWEVAATWDPTAGRARPYPWGDAAPDAGETPANLSWAGYGGPGPDGAFQALLAAPGRFPRDLSPLGLVAAGGNAAEWCAGALPLPGRQPLRGASIRTDDAFDARAATRREHDPRQPPPADAGFRTVAPFEG